MISVADAQEHGIEVVEAAATWFWRSNARTYGKVCMEKRDLISYLYEKILFKSYIPYVEKRPDFWATIANFRSSLYTACKKALFADIRKYDRSLKRSIGLRDGACVPLDQQLNEDSGDRTNDVLGMESDSSIRIKEFIDGLPNDLLQRVAILIINGKVNRIGKLEELIDPYMLAGSEYTTRDLWNEVKDRLREHVKECNLPPANSYGVLRQSFIPETSLSKRRGKGMLTKGHVFMNNGIQMRVLDNKKRLDKLSGRVIEVEYTKGAETCTILN